MDFGRKSSKMDRTGSKQKRPWIKVEVNEPVTITSREFLGWSSSVTTYSVRIETNHWAFSLPRSEVRRRYSEFVWLRSKLQTHHPNKVVPPIPPKHYFHGTRFDTELIEARRAGLAKFLQRVMRSNVFLSDAALHLFLQSELSLEQIEERLSEDECGGGAKVREGTQISPPPTFLCRSCSSSSTASSLNDESGSVSSESELEDAIDIDFDLQF